MNKTNYAEQVKRELENDYVNLQNDCMNLQTNLEIRKEDRNIERSSQVEQMLSGTQSVGVVLARKAGVSTGVIQATASRYNDLKALFMSPENATEYYKNRDNIQAQTRQDINSRIQAADASRLNNYKSEREDFSDKNDFKQKAQFLSEKVSQLSSKYSGLFETETDAYSCDIGEDVSY